MSKPHILVVDDERDIRGLVQEILEDEGYEVDVAENGGEARRARVERRPDLILLDIWMPDVDGITLLKEWRDGERLPCPVIVMSGHATVETAVEATRLGAYDFLEKPLSTAKLVLTARRALEAERLFRENVGLRREAPQAIEPTGRAPVMQQLREQARRIARHDTWVLISGEPGSGKETLARYIHAQSERAGGPFIEVGVASIARENSSVELFGSETAGKVQYGRLEQASGGTLFLDEVGDMDRETQARLIGALETGTFLRVGGKNPVAVDVRVIAATHRDLAGAAAQGRFSRDLYDHLNVTPLRVPSLREHGEDVPDLLAHYVTQFVDREGLPYRHFSTAAQNRLRQYHWPGNVRELKNLVQRLLIIGGDEEIGAAEVEGALGAQPRAAAPAAPAGVSFDQPLRDAREQFERAYLEYQLQASGGNIAQLARASGMERTHLYRKLRALGIDPRQLGGDNK